MFAKDYIKNKIQELLNNKEFWDSISHFQHVFRIIPQKNSEVLLPEMIPEKLKEIAHAAELLDFIEVEKTKQELTNLIKEWFKVIKYLCEKYFNLSDYFKGDFNIQLHPGAKFIVMAMLLDKDSLKKKSFTMIMPSEIQ